MTQETKTAIKHYTLWLEGTWGRNRKAKRENFELVEVENELTNDELKIKLESKLSQLKPKGEYSIKVTVSDMFIKNCGGVQIKEWMPFSDNKKTLINEKRVA